LHWLAQRLPDFRTGARDRSGPLVDLHSTDTEPSFRHDEADGDIRYLFDDDAKTLPDDMRAEEIARPVVFPVAAPSFRIGRHGALRQREDILDLPMIQERSDAEWANWLSLQGLSPKVSQPVARYGQAHLALVAARSGQGVALANHYLVADDLASGRLVMLSPDDGPGSLSGWEPTISGAAGHAGTSRLSPASGDGCTRPWRKTNRRGPCRTTPQPEVDAVARSAPTPGVAECAPP
jgi:DNA-binding transcriptional LysR family regulator